MIFYNINLLYRLEIKKVVTDLYDRKIKLEMFDTNTSIINSKMINSKNINLTLKSLLQYMFWSCACMR